MNILKQLKLINSNKNNQYIDAFWKSVDEAASLLKIPNTTKWIKDLKIID